MENAFATFLLNSGLYDTIDVTEENIEELCSLIAGEVRISSFCPQCKAERVFTMSPITYREDIGTKKFLANELRQIQHLHRSCGTEQGDKPSEWGWNYWQTQKATRIMMFSFVCAMDEEHRLDYVVRTENNTLQKIGQFPSVADLTFPELNQYKKVLSKENMKDLHKAIGLFASGIGAGSYVYLRRVIERMIDTAKSEAITSGKLTTKDFEGVRFSEQIILLKDALPEILVNNPTVYGIVSKGIHELSEEECISYFPILKECIFSIAEEWEAIRARKQRQKEMNSALSRIANQVK